MTDAKPKLKFVHRTTRGGDPWTVWALLVPAGNETSVFRFVETRVDDDGPLGQGSALDHARRFLRMTESMC